MSLRGRLLSMTAAVLGVALGMVALLSMRVVTAEFRRLLVAHGQQPGNLEALAARIAADRLRSGSWNSAHRELAETGLQMRRELMVLDAGGRLVAASGPAETYASVRAGDGGRWLEVRRKGPSGTRILQFVEPYRAALTAPSGQPLGLLLATPLPPAESPSSDVVGRIRRALLLAAIAGGSVGLLLSFALARRILRPVEALTAAAGRMEAGDLAQRVDIKEHSEIGELACAFNAMAERLATAERLRRDLVNDVAHELRGPLTNLRGQLEALDDRLLTPTREVLRSLGDEVHLLERIVDDLGDLALAEAGQLALARGALDLAAEIERAVKSVAPGVDAPGPRIETVLPAGLPEVAGDSRRVGQILRNLLTNAMTHTPPAGKVHVRARLDGSEVIVEVEDSGSGIPAEHLPFLFDRFYRADSSRSRATGGAGLGLAIVKQLAAAQGGRVWVHSEVGKGSTFGFSLPAAWPAVVFGGEAKV
ncbi:MAG: HAMP domain-containing protein [Acidobacteria bacterium]|nr:HAMP domain-containing protein [Acidobacteriota bacterium]